MSFRLKTGGPAPKSRVKIYQQRLIPLLNKGIFRLTWWSNTSSKKMFSVLSIFVLFIAGTLSISITNHTYTQAEITLNGGQKMKLVLFAVDFNQKVFLNGTDVASLPLTPVNIGQSIFPRSMTMQMGATVLRCPCSGCGSSQFPECNATVCSYSSIPQMSNGPPTSLLPLPAVKEPVYIIFSVMAGKDVTSLNPQALENRTMVGKIKEFYDPALGSWVSLVPPSLDPSQCILEFSSTGNSTFTNQSGNKIGPLSTSGPFVEFKGPCNSTEYRNIALQLFDSIANMSLATSSDLVQNQAWALAAYMARDAWLSCTRLAEDLLVYELTNRTLTGDQSCHYTTDQPEWALDPCCNSRLNYDQCCVPRVVQIQEEAVVGFDQQKVVARCGSPDKANLVLSQYVLNSQQAELCDDQAKRNGYDVGAWDTVMRFVTTCNQDIFGTGGPPSCKTNDDCWTRCDATLGQCVIPWDDLETPLTNCFVQTMDAELQRYLRKKWGLTAQANTTEFLNVFRTNMLNPGCKGPNSWLYNGYWNSSIVFNCTLGDTNCSCFVNGGQNVCQTTTYVPPNQAGCLAEQACNWVNWPTQPNATYCAAKTPSPFCGDCHGSCYDRTVLSTCSIPWINTQGCLNRGGTPQQGNPMWCTLSQGSNNTQCIPSGLCSPPPPGQSPLNDQCSASCYLAGVNTSSACLARAANGITPAWDNNTRINGTGVCRLPNIWSEPACNTSGITNATWFHGRYYVSGWYDTPPKCATGQCSLGSWIPQDQCAQTAACTQTCKTCESKAGKQSFCFQLTNSTYCTNTLFGVYNSGICSFDWFQTKSSCEAAGHIFETCQGLNISVCRACDVGIGNCSITQNAVLQCRVNPWGQCATQTDCEASGTCDDWEYTNWISDYCRDPNHSNTVNCTGGCVLAF